MNLYLYIIFVVLSVTRVWASNDDSPGTKHPEHRESRVQSKHRGGTRDYEKSFSNDYGVQDSIDRIIENYKRVAKISTFLAYSYKKEGNAEMATRMYKISARSYKIAASLYLDAGRYWDAANICFSVAFYYELHGMRSKAAEMYKKTARLFEHSKEYVSAESMYRKAKMEFLILGNSTEAAKMRIKESRMKRKVL